MTIASNLLSKVVVGAVLVLMVAEILLLMLILLILAETTCTFHPHLLRNFLFWSLVFFLVLINVWLFVLRSFILNWLLIYLNNHHLFAWSSSFEFLNFLLLLLLMLMGRRFVTLENVWGFVIGLNFLNRFEYIVAFYGEAIFAKELVNLIDFHLRQISKLFRALRVNPATVGTFLFSSFTFHHYF
jgi:hypothetical protein